MESTEHVTGKGIVLKAVLTKNSAGRDVVMAMVDNHVHDVDEIAVAYGNYVFTTMSAEDEGIYPVVLKIVAT